jgi:hypothetical protein
VARLSKTTTTLTWNLMQIDPNTVILDITVEEHAELQERIGTILDSGNHASRREGRLFNIAMEILRVLVES